MSGLSNKISVEYMNMTYFKQSRRALNLTVGTGDLQSDDSKRINGQTEGREDGRMDGRAARQADGRTSRGMDKATCALAVFNRIVRN